MKVSARVLSFLGGGMLLALLLGYAVRRSGTVAAAATVSEGEILASWFAVGDSGWSAPFHRGQRHVAEAIEFLDRERPADGLLLLGDNFYPEGLRADDLEGHLIDELVGPFCRFTELTRSWIRSPPRCQRSEQLREIWAVLGNHDHGSAESPLLQRAWIETRISNWRMPEDVVERYRIAPGVDLVAYDSQRLMEGADPAAVTAALRAAPGPWRIVAAHHPLRMDWERYDERSEAERVRSAVARAAVPVQLAVAGHEHNLQVIDLEEPLLGLQVIAGGGSRHRPIEGHLHARLLGVENLGFARIELVEGPPQRLRVTLFSVATGLLPSSWPRPWTVRPQEAGSFDIGLDGRFSAPRAD